MLQLGCITFEEISSLSFLFENSLLPLNSTFFIISFSCKINLQFKKLYIEDTNGNVKEIKIFGDLYIFFNLAEDEAVWTSGLKYQCGNDNYDKFYLHLHNRNEMDWEKLSKNNPHTDMGHYVIFY